MELYLLRYDHGNTLHISEFQNELATVGKT